MVTSAPASRAAAAMAKPIFPELRLLMKRTGSMRSRVGPAVSSTRLPARGPEGASVPETNPASCSGSSMRPAPTSPQAWSPSPGPQTWMPRDLSVATLAWVAALLHIRRFIAGASAIGASVARHKVVRRSSACPVASRARKSAVAGAMITKSAQRASSMCDMAFSASGSHKSLRTSRPDTAWNVIGVTNSRAPAVSTTCTSAPCSRRRRTRSGLL
jgi:hypothetical protein